MEEYHISEITPNLYLGDMIAAYDEYWLKSLGIRKILSIIDSFGITYPKETFIHKIINIGDTQYSNLLQYFKECLLFIDGNEKVFVHCGAGISRSSTIIIAYVMWKGRKSLNDAIKFVKSKRKVICPNPGFLEQLKIFEKLLNVNNYDLNAINFSEVKINNINSNTVSYYL